MSDLIRREDAVSRISDLLMIELQGKRLPTWNEVYNAINGIPSAEPDRKTFHVIDKTTGKEADPYEIALNEDWAKSEEPPIGEPPDYIPLSFHQLAEMIGEPVYVKDRGCKGHWEIITAVRKTLDGEDVAFRGTSGWERIGKDIYRTKEGAEQ